jgi:hypothetical protein
MGFFKDCGCGCNGAKAKQKFITALVAALVFFVIANPQTFQIVRKVLGSVVASPNGCATQVGVLVHSIVFFLIILALLNIKRETYVVDDTPSSSEPVVETPKIISAKTENKPKQVSPIKEIKMEIKQPTPTQTSLTPQVNKPAPTPDVFEPIFEPVDGKFNVGCVDLEKVDTPY